MIFEIPDAVMKVSGEGVKKVLALRVKNVVNFFCEPGTRTKASCE